MGPDSEPRPFPSFATALALTLVAWWTAYLALALVVDWAGKLPAMAFGWLLGYGLVGWLALAQVRAPWQVSVGLRVGRMRQTVQALLLSCLWVPGVQIQALALAAVGDAGRSADLAWGTRFVLTETVPQLAGSWIVFALLVPVTTEFFFRGLIQQGLVARFGAGPGVLLAAGLSAVAAGGLRRSVAVFVAVGLSALLWGIVAGMLRRVSGSLVPGIVFYAALHTGGLAAMASKETTAIAVLNTGGTLVPLWLLAPATLVGAVGLAWLIRDLVRAPEQAVAAD